MLGNSINPTDSKVDTSEAKRFDTPSKTLEFIIELQDILTTNTKEKKLMIGYNDLSFKQSQSEIWFKKDEKIIVPLLQKIQKEFGLNSIGVIQKAAPGYNNEFLVVPPSNEDSNNHKLLELLEERMYELDKDLSETDSQKRCGTYLSDSKFSLDNDSIELVFPCSINNKKENTFGFLGLIPTIEQAKEMLSGNDKVKMKLLKMLSNQLGLFFSHLNLLRKKALNERLTKTVEAIDTRISNLENPNNTKQIFEDLADFISNVFNQHHGAIYSYNRKDNKLIKVVSLNESNPAPIATEELFQNPDILNIIKSSKDLDNTTKEIKLPISHIFPLSSTYNRYSRVLILFDSPKNSVLSKEEINAISNRLKDKIGAHLQTADDFENRIASISKFRKLLKSITNSNDMQEEMINMISDHLKVDIISYMEVDHTGKYVIFKYGKGLPDDVKTNETKELISNSISGLVVRYGKTLYIKDLNDFAHIKSLFPEEPEETLKKLFSHQHITNYSTESMLSVPLITGIGDENKKVAGVINVNNKNNQKPFSENDKLFLEAIAELVAEGINNVNYLSESQERELLNKNAREIQMSLMPKERDFKRLPKELDIFGESIPAKEVGGDLFTTVKMEDGRLLTMLGDVSGKGSSAAIIMAIAQTIFKTLAPDENNLVTFLYKANKYLSAEMEGMDGKFVTLQLIAINIENGECEFASAGHGPLFIRRLDKNEEIKPHKGMPLGLFAPPLMPFETTTFTMKPGESVVMFTDGLYEETNSKNEMFGTDRIKEIMSQESYNKDAKSLTKALISSCQNWREGSDAHDDLTVLTIKYRGKANNE